MPLQTFDLGEIPAARSLAVYSLALAYSIDDDREKAGAAAQNALTQARGTGDRASARIALRALVACARADGRNEAALNFVYQLRAAGDGNLRADEIELLELLDDVHAARALLAQTEDQQDDEGTQLHSRLAIAELRYLKKEPETRIPAVLPRVHAPNLTCARSCREAQLVQFVRRCTRAAR